MSLTSVINVQDISKYPENYNFLTAEQQEIVVNYMNGMQALANRYYESYIDFLLNENEDQANQYLKLYNHTVTSLSGSKNAYATLNIMVEYDWLTHVSSWALMTKTDAENYIAATDEASEDPAADDLLNDLLDYSDVGQ